MADTATFSSFRRPVPPRKEPPVEHQPVAAATPILSPQAILADAMTSAPRQDQEAEPAPMQEADDATPSNASASASASADSVPSADQWAVLRIGLGADQLGLAHPDVIVLQAMVRGAAPVVLEAHTAGIYRPPGFRPAPWSGFAYDQSSAVSTGLAAGTRILTARGEVEVEQLVPGDAAMGLRGPGLLPISWIGRTASASAPICIEPGALGPDTPRRPLRVGPDQNIFLKPDPVAAHTLVNGTTIRSLQAEPPELFHIDVGRAEIILAEGVALASSHGASKPR